MTELPVQSMRIPFEPRDIPGLVSFWNFTSSGDSFCAEQGERYILKSQSGPLNVVEDPDAAFGGKALVIEEGQWLSVDRKECPKLDIHGKEGHLTVVAWIKRGKTKVDQCEFVAGMWNESQLGRQYGLFLNIRVWGYGHRIFGHLSHVGGPTPGYKYCMDGSMGATDIAVDEWAAVAMSYDGQSGSSWLNGHLDAVPGLNPYSIAGGLHDGGPEGSDFTVGAVDRSGEIGNFFCGRLAALAVYDRALTPAEMHVLCNR
ncbi:LamG domain-containing protein [Kiritimatiellaeota bacterium B1221]|nr:LamG domain-containing protein [Kiritimatiellaeota bacterium B1221]